MTEEMKEKAVNRIPYGGFMFCRAPNCRPGTKARIGSYYCGRHQRYETTKAKASKKHG